jgi:ribonuclease H
MKLVKLFSDGSCLNNPGRGGWAFILEYGEYKLKKSGSESFTTNNKMELTAVIMGLKALKFPCEVELYSDSSYVVNGINGWIFSWIKKNFKDVKNPELWREYLQVSAPHKIRAFWVKGHDGHPQNEECDELARKAALAIKEQKVKSH